MQMWYSDGTPKLRHIAPPGIFIISTFSSQSCQSLVNTSKESIELFECQRKSTSAKCKASVVSSCGRIVSIFPHTATVVTVRPILQQWFTSQRVHQSKTAAICWRAFHGHWTKRKKYNSGKLALHLPSSGFSRILLTKNDFIILENVV